MTRPDYTKIAVLEYELFGITPELGTEAARITLTSRIERFAQEMRHQTCDHADTRIGRCDACRTSWEEPRTKESGRTKHSPYQWGGGGIIGFDGRSGRRGR